MCPSVRGDGRAGTVSKPDAQRQLLGAAAGSSLTTDLHGADNDIDSMAIGPSGGGVEDAIP